MSDTVEFRGQSFRLADRLGLMPMMRLAKVQRSIAGKSESEITDEEGTDLLLAMLDLLERCVADGEWPRLEEHLSAIRADMDDIDEFTTLVMEAMAQRPTGRSSDSSDGPRIIEPSSTVVSSSADGVIARLNAQGRPDLALVARKRQESLSA